MNFLAPILSFLESSKYVLIFIGCYLEGSTVMMTTGLLWRTGTFAFWPAYGTLLLADVLSDIMWYVIGLYGARPFVSRFGHWFGASPEVVARIERKFNHHHTRILAISKLTMGFGFAVPVLITAGILHVPFKRFVIINTLGSLVWVLGNMAIGYYFGNLVVDIPREFQIALLIALPVFFFTVIKLLSKKLQTLGW